MAQRLVLHMAPPQNMPTMRYGLIMPLPLKELIQQRAEEEGTSMNELMVRLLSQSLQWKPEENLAALSDEDLLRTLGVDVDALPVIRATQSATITDDDIALVREDDQASAPETQTEGIDVSHITLNPKGGRRRG